MERLCERPGCSDRAAVAYGMRAEDLVFWLDVIGDRGADGGVLCRRHADTMVVPRGWTLDDLRDPDLHLFRPPAAVPTIRERPPRSQRPVGDDTGEQLRLTDVARATVPASVHDLGDPVDVVDTDHAQSAMVGDDAGPVAPARVSQTDADDAEVWTPTFDEADDLDGLLSARSPLLARAFRVADRVDD